MRLLALGMGWFPDERGGSNRYFRELLERVATADVSAQAVVVGPADSHPDSVRVAGSRYDSLISRLRKFSAIATRVGASADIVDAHFALYAFSPVVLGRLRRKPLVVHFHGPWADESAVAVDSRRLVLAAKRALERAVYRRADLCVTLSAAFKKVLVERYGVEPWSIKVIPPVST